MPATCAPAVAAAAAAAERINKAQDEPSVLKPLPSATDQFLINVPPATVLKFVAKTHYLLKS